MKGIGTLRAGAALGALWMLTLVPRVAGAQVVTLEELETLALKNDARWAMTDVQSREADARMALAKAGRKPTFLLDLDAAAQPGTQIVQVPTLEGETATVRSAPPVGQPNAFRVDPVYHAEFTMHAPLYDFGRTRTAIEAAQTQRAVSSAWDSQDSEALLRRLRASYLSWLYAHSVHHWTTESATDALAQRDRVAQRVQDGERPGADLTAAQHEALERQLAATDSQAELDRARRRIEQLVGEPLPPKAEPDTRLLTLQTPDDAEPASAEADALMRESEVARLEAGTLRKSRRPVLAATARTGVRGVGNDVFPGYRLGVNLAVPLWDGGKIAAEAELAEAQAMELEAEAAQSRSAAQSAQEQARADRLSAETQLPLAEQLVAVAEERVEQAEASYELGLGGLDDIASARTALRAAQSRLVSVQVARADAILRSSSP